jgi:FkbM family methyltransferase
MSKSILARRLRRLARPIAERFPLLMSSYRYARDNRKILDEPPLTALGFRLLGNQAMEQGRFEPVETDLIKALLPRTQVFINVGANIGYYCCLAAQAGKQVVAFEPMPGNLQYLYRNVRANGWGDRIEIFPIALSDAPGIMEMFGHGTGASLVKGWAGASDRFSTLVPVSTLDTVLHSRFEGQQCLLLVDVEGAEKQLLAGATRFLQRHPKPAWMIEIAISEHQPQGIAVNPHLLSTFQMLWDAGYEARAVGRQLRLVQREEIERIAAGGPDVLGTHNFLFIEKDGAFAELTRMGKW